jgi:hypothetical protein
MKERGARLVIVVDAHEKTLPSEHTAGRLEASVLVVDWLAGTTRCEVPLSVEQLTGDTRAFKAQVAAELSNAVRLLSSGGLELAPP